MQVSKPQSALLQTAPIQIGKTAFLGISVGVGFRLSDPRVLCHEASVWTALSQVPSSVALTEVCLPKQYAEWMLIGHATQQIGPKNTKGKVQWNCSVKLADVERSLVCQAHWSNVKMVRLQLDPRHAWCGSEQENPCGASSQATQLHSRTLLGPALDPLAATGPLDMRWTARARFRPTMHATPGEAASDGSHFGWPAHTDVRYFQQAPQSQWFNAASWPLGAAYAMSGFGPKGDGYSRCLPTLSARAAHKEFGSSHFEAIDLLQQTIWFLPDSDIGVMWWRGQIRLAYLLEDPVQHLVIALSDASEPVRMQAIADVANKRAQRKERDFACESDHWLMPSVSKGWVVTIG